MGRNSGNIRNVAAKSGGGNVVPDNVNVNSIKSGLLSYSQTDRLNRNTDYQMGFNDQAQALIEEIAKGDYGLATTIAKQAVERSGWGRYGTRLSEKQAYLLAKAAYDNKLKGVTSLIFRDNSKEAAELDARQRAARHARNARRAERDTAVASSNGLRRIASGERVLSGSSVFSKSGDPYTVVQRKGDIFTLRDKNGRVFTLHKSKVYLR